MDFAPDGKTLATAEGPGPKVKPEDLGKWNCVRLIDPNSGKQIKKRGFTKAMPYSATYAPDGETLAILVGVFVDGAREIMLLDARSFERLPIKPLPPGIGERTAAVGFSPDGELLAATYKGYVYSPTDRSENAKPTKLAGRAHGGQFTFSPDCSLLASVRSDRKNWNNLEKRRRNYNPFDDPYHEYVVLVWETATGKKISQFVDHRRHMGITSLAFSPDGGKLATGGKEGIVRLWNVATGKLLRAIDSGSAWVPCVAWSPDGSLLAYSAYSGVDGVNATYLWDVKAGRVVEKFDKWGSVLAFSPTAPVLAVESADIYFWNYKTGKIVTYKRPPLPPPQGFRKPAPPPPDAKDRLVRQGE